MVPRDHGTIVLVGSALAYRGIPLQAPYCASKHAVQGFFESLRSELQHERSRVHLGMVQLPALNTPQFGWLKSRMPKKAQPVPPIFQPEVAARAILEAAWAKRRELIVGWPAFKAIWGNKLLPRVADWYLAKTGYDSQQRDEPEEPGRPHNLYEPVPGDHGAHGLFDARAKDTSVMLELSLRRGLVGAVAAGLLAAGAALLWRTR
jgi:hypothetical protein